MGQTHSFQSSRGVTGAEAPQPETPETPTDVQPETPAETPAEAQPETPAAPREKILGKFDSPEALAAAYLSLERKLAQSAGDLGGETPEGETPEGAETPADRGPLDFQPYFEEWGATGELSDQSYAELEASGIGRTVVDMYLAGQRAADERQAAELTEAVGGADNYQRMVTWAKDAWSPAQKDGFNRAVASGDMEIARMAIAGLRASYESTVGRAPQAPVQGRPAVGSGGGATPYQSQAQMIADMRKPEYAQDPAFRDTVQRRIKATPEEILQ